jgi:outer membrane protein assembly factor BamB
MSYAVQIAQFAGAAPRGLKVQYDQSQQLSIRSDLGNLLTNAAVRSNDGTIRRYIAVPNNALTARAHGHLVLVNFGAEVIAIDALRGERAAVDSLLWRQESADLDLATSRSLYAQQRTVNNPLVGTRYISYDSSGRLNFNTGPLQMAGVCYQKGRLLICADLLTGQSIWERGQIPAQAEIFGDGEMIFVADAAGEVQVLSAIDGTLLGKRKIERSDRRWTTYGRNVLAWDQVGTTLKVRLYDVWQQDAKPADTVPAQPAEAVPAQPADNIPAGQPADLWSHQVPQGTKGCVIDGEEVALLEPSGQLTVVSLDTGELKFAVPLEPEPSLDYVVVQRSRDQYVLMTMQNNPTPPPGLLVNPLSSANSPQARIHGRAYAFARSTGKLQWQVPAFVAMHALPIDQPAESPLLLFVRNRTDVKEGGANRQAASVLCLDKRDGRVVFDSDTDPNLKERRPPAANHSEIIADPVKRTVTLSLNNQATPTTFVFQVTDKPFPPQPPAQTGEVASTSVGELPGTVDQSVGQAVERLNRGEDPSRLFPAAPPVRGISPRPPLPR